MINVRNEKRMPKLGVGISEEADFYYHRDEKGLRNMAWKTTPKGGKDMTEEVEAVKDDYVNAHEKPFDGDYFPTDFINLDSKPFKEMVKKSEKWKDMENEEKRKMASSTRNEIEKVLGDIGVLLITKNEQYGDSALSPNRIFSKASTDEQIKVRIDDKLNRLMLGNDSIESDDDIIKDLIGYLVLLLVSQGRQD